MAAEPDCIFCRIVAGELPATVVREDERTFAFMDINPWSRGHVLVIPREHAKDIHAIDPEDLAAVHIAAQDVARRQLEALDADGVNLWNSTGKVAGQVVFHFHLHVIPRYADDGIGNPVGRDPAVSEPEQIAEAARALA
jgi:histidine triad (HIT) family protein